MNTALDSCYQKPGPVGEPCIEVRLVTWDTDKRYCFSSRALVEQDRPTEKAFRLVLNALALFRFTAEYDVLERRRRATMHRFRHYVQTGEDEFTEFDPISLKLLDRKVNDLGWSEAEQEYA